MFLSNLAVPVKVSYKRVSYENKCVEYKVVHDLSQTVMET